MVCQNQSIDDFDAPLARDLRLLVRGAVLLSGDSDTQVLDFLHRALRPISAAQATLLACRLRFCGSRLLPRCGPASAASWFCSAGRAQSPTVAELEQPKLTAAESGRLAELLGDGKSSTGRLP